MISAVGAKSLADGLRTNKSIASINLSCKELIRTIATARPS